MEQPINNPQGTEQPVVDQSPVVGSPPQDRRASDAQDRRMSDEWGQNHLSHCLEASVALQC